MGFYSRRVFPFLLDRTLSRPALGEQRKRVLAGVSGEVLELGFGTGLNLPHYPTAVRKVTAVDPNPGMGARALRRIQASPILVERRVLGGERLPFPDASFDAVVSTWTLCSIPDAGAALREARRVLRPHGKLHFLEHGLAPDPGVQAWQRRLAPLFYYLGDGCRPDRDIGTLVSDAGFKLETLERFYLHEGPRVGTSLYLGLARP